MSTKTKESLKIVSQEEIGTGIFSMWLQADRMAEAARPGQFLSLSKHLIHQAVNFRIE